MVRRMVGMKWFWKSSLLQTIVFAVLDKGIDSATTLGYITGRKKQLHEAIDESKIQMAFDPTCFY